MDEAFVEHDGAKVMIAELLGSAPGKDFFDAKMKVLSEEIKHHVKEEERPRRWRVRPGARGRPRHGGARRAAWPRARRILLAQFKSKGLPPPKTRSFTGHRLEQSKEVAAA